MKMLLPLGAYRRQTWGSTILNTSNLPVPEDRLKSCLKCRPID